ncbi:MAG: pitrilysin family protein [Rhodothermales bacterium]
MMKTLLALLLLALAALPATAQESKIFPYDYEVRDLDNGLRVIVLPTDYPNIVSLYIPVSVGSRNEVEEGKSGFAHFFEHMMFRGTEAFPAAKYQALLKNAGADQNAYTTDDRTVYHTTFSKDDLETMLMLEADRFQNLQYSDADFRTEALAVLGEYNKNAANPVSKLFEVQREAAFDAHTYKHTTMGFIEDIEAMPDQFDYSRQFFDRFYRPEKTAIIVAGDVEPDAVFSLVEQYWGDWERGTYAAEIPVEPAPDGALYEHVAWESPTLPWVTVAFRGPASYGADDADMRAADIIASYAFSPSSDLYKKLVVDEQKVDQLFASFPDRADPALLTVGARVKDPADVWTVRDEIQRTLADLRANGVEAERMNAIKSNLKYGFANGLDNSEAIASSLASYVAATRDVETVNEIYARYDALTPAAVQAAANTYFTDERMIVVTLSHEDLPGVDSNVGSVDDRVADAAAMGGDTMGGGAGPAPTDRPPMATLRVATTPNEKVFETIVQRLESPLVDFRFLFLTGAADDPEGKEGLAELTARMVADAGSKTMTFSEIQQALFPLAAGFGTQVDKEMTVFGGRTHRDNLERYYEIMSGQLLSPGFRDEDFQRLKSNLINEIRVGLRSNNDEELGKEVLYEMIYAGHPYGHLTLGHIDAVESITLDDVRQFYRENYTQRNLTLGLAGDVPPAFLAHVESDLTRLPEGEITRQAPITEPAMPDGITVTLVEKDTRGAAISMGFPIEVTRSHPDFAALWLVRSYFGEHRSSNAHLFQRIREARGMNYGDYAYIEYFPRGMYQFHPDANLARYSQIFQIWIRPVPPEQTHFAIRAAMYELQKLVRDGMTEEDFEATRNYLLKFVNVLTQSQGRQLGYALDSQFYGNPAFTEFIRQGLQNLTLDEVNRVLREHLQAEDMALVVVTPNAENLADRLAKDTPSPITYNAPKPDEIMVEDEVIQQLPLGIDREDIRIVPADEVFETGVFAE